MLQTTCTCGAKLEYPEANAGTKLRCPRCQAVVETLAAEGTPVAPDAKSPQATQVGEPEQSLRLFLQMAGEVPACDDLWTARQRKALAGVVIAVGVLAIGLLLAQGAAWMREKAAHLQDMNNLKRLGLSLHGYHDVHRKLPSAYGLPRQPMGDEGEHSLFVQLLPVILPWVDDGDVFKQPHVLPKHAGERGTVSFSTFLSPFEETTNSIGRTNYAGNIRIFSDIGAKTDAGASVPLGGAMANSFSLHRIQDGTSNTLAFATRYGECGTPNVPTLFDGLRPNQAGSPFFGAGTHSMPAADFAADDLMFQLVPPPANCRPTASVYGHSFRLKGLSIALCDGTVGNISPTIAVRIYQGALCPHDGVPVVDWSE